MTAKHEKPILFSGPMVRAILDGRKTQTRRICAPLCGATGVADVYHRPDGRFIGTHLPVGQGVGITSPFPAPWAVGDRLWVRETWAPVNSACGPGFAYRADGAFIQPEYDGKDYGAGPSFNYEKYPGEYTMWYSDLLSGADGHPWKPSIHMPRWASRITLKVTGVKVERLNAISENDAIAEGVQPSSELDGRYYLTPLGESATAKLAFHLLWESINGKGSWDLNPWVWAISFRRVEQMEKAA